MGEVVMDRNGDWKSNGDTYRRMTKYVGYGTHIIQRIHKETPTFWTSICSAFRAQLIQQRCLQNTKIWSVRKRLNEKYLTDTINIYTELIKKKMFELKQFITTVLHSENVDFDFAF